MSEPVTGHRMIVGRELLATSADLGTQLVRAAPEDFAYVDMLRKREGGALGFVPKQRYEAVMGRYSSAHNGARDFLYEFVLLTLDNEDCTGFAYVRFSVSTAKASIWQIAIQEDARRWHRAVLISDWVEAEALRRGCARVEARVAADLESNLFWRGAGYQIAGERHSTFLCRTAAKSKRPLNLYVKHLTLPWQDSLLEVSA